MELTECALFLTVLNLVSASPYRYGVKGGAGASAAAEASAVAGAYENRGDIPPGNAFGGLSGSFTKSSSASSSSSSASSSSSSSSFSYNGYVPGDYASPTTNTNTGCTSSLCQNSGTNHQDYSTDAAASNSEYGTLPEADCQGSLCNTKCSSGQCQTKPQSYTSPNVQNLNGKCNSGQCGPTAPTVPSQYDDSEDIHFVAHSTKTLDSKDHSFNDKSTGYIGGSGCHYGNCNPSSINTQSPGSANSHYNPSPTNNPQTTSSNFESSPDHKLPANNLETPYLNSKCNSVSCKQGDIKPVYEIPSTSYGFPILGTHDEQKPLCIKGKCDNQEIPSSAPTTTNSLPSNYLSPQDLHPTKGPSYANPVSSCTSSNCGTTSSKPSQDAFIPPGCISPNCYSTYTSDTPANPISQPGQNVYSEPTDKIKHKEEKLPVYTGGFGAPAGILKPNEYNTPASGTYYPTQPTITFPSKPTVTSTTTGCNTPGCSNPIPSSVVAPQSHYGSNKPLSNENQPVYTGGFGGPPGILKPNEFILPTSSPTKPGYFGNPTYNKPSPVGSSPTVAIPSIPTFSTSYGPHKDVIPSSGNNLPIYTGGFGGPTGMLTPDDSDIKVPIHSQDDIKVPVHSSHPSYHNPLPVTGCNSNSPNCNVYVPSGSYGVSSVPQTTNNYKPINIGTNLSPVRCTTGNCLRPSTAEITPQPSFNAPKPIALTDPSSITFPEYTSHYKPIGVDYHNNPAVAPISLTYVNTEPHHPIDTFCKTGNCVNQPGHNSNIPTGAFHKHDNYAGCKKGNCFNYPVTGVDVSALPSSQDAKNPHFTGKQNIPQYPSALNSPSTPIDYASSDSSGTNTGAYSQSGSKQNLPGYTGGFGPPSGILKPNDYSKPSIHVPNKHVNDISTPTCSSGKCNPTGTVPPSTGYNVGCNDGNCFNYPVTGVDVSAIPSSQDATYPEFAGKPDSPRNLSGFNIPSRPIDYAVTGSSDSSATNTGAYSQSGSNQNLPGYIGGFGAPPGLLKPNGYSKPNTQVPYKPVSDISTPACSSGKCNPTGAEPPSTIYNGGCKKGNCFNYPVTGADVSAIPSSQDATYPEFAGKPNSPQNPSAFNIPSRPIDYAVTGSSYSSATNTGAYSQSGSNQNLPGYTGGFGAPPGLLKPNDYLKPNTQVPNKPVSDISTPTCSSGKCNPTGALSPSTGYDVGFSASQASASSSASANAIAYTGGFGGPPGFLTPYDSGKVDLNKIRNLYNDNLSHGDVNTPNINGVGPTSAGSNIRVLSGNAADASSISGSIGNNNHGSYGYNTPGNHQAGNGVKEASPCAGGCGSGYQATGSSAATGVKTHNFGIGGSYAGSSASAYSSAGSYTKGGYGKR